MGIDTAIGRSRRVLAYNGVIGNNTHRKLEVDECRGFASGNSI